MKEIKEINFDEKIELKPTTKFDHEPFQNEKEIHPDYFEKVNQYKTYKIGRKASDNTSKFQKMEISEGRL